jgi:hypothetical protein
VKPIEDRVRLGRGRALHRAHAGIVAIRQEGEARVWDCMLSSSRLRLSDAGRSAGTPLLCENSRSRTSPNRRARGRHDWWRPHTWSSGTATR